MTFEYVIEEDNTKTRLQKIYYGFYMSHVHGYLLIGVTENNQICYTTFFEEPFNRLERLSSRFPGAELIENNDLIKQKLLPIFEDHSQNKIVNFLFKGTEFQTRIWKELMNVKEGTTTTYEGLARMVGCPRAVRAVANAVAKNPLALLVPCHRIISKCGGIGKYHYGSHKKAMLLRLEKAI